LLAVVSVEKVFFIRLFGTGGPGAVSWDS
jgi:hypothetical protein